MSDRCKLFFLSPNCRFQVSSHISTFHVVPQKWRACSQAKDDDDDDDSGGSDDDGDDDDDVNDNDDHHHDDQR